MWEGYGDNNAPTLAGANNANVVTDRFNNQRDTWPIVPDSFIQKTMSGIFNQTKYLPLRFMPITIEVSLVDDVAEPIVFNLAYAVVGFTNATTSNIWQTQNVQAKCDIAALDSGPN